MRVINDTKPLIPAILYGRFRRKAAERSTAFFLRRGSESFRRNTLTQRCQAAKKQQNPIHRLRRLHRFKFHHEVTKARNSIDAIHRIYPDKPGLLRSRISIGVHTENSSRQVAKPQRTNIHRLRRYSQIWTDTTISYDAINRKYRIRIYYKWQRVNGKLGQCSRAEMD